MGAVVLRLRAAPAVPLEAPCIRPDHFAALSEAEIARLPVWHGSEARALGDFFDVRGGHADDVRVKGELSRVKHLGAEMAGGRLVIEGDAGPHAGAGMAGGTLRIEGDAAAWAGAEMRGGVLEVRGRVRAYAGGAYAGSRWGMAGGLLLVHGDAGDFLGVRMRRGTIAVAGCAGECAGAEMIAGSILVFGDVGRRPGFGLKRGSIVVHGAVEPPPTYRYACTYRPPHLALYLRELARRGLPIEERFLGGAYRRYNGDFAELPRGEILAWTT
ncbi:MAG: formylmethanofuran dehydrogenase subunit C [Gemmatimonadetes bacterium]|nr:formylmethanofuran dehydrogenase subunit C [Gemmatimonadota bacterium]